MNAAKLQLKAFVPRSQLVTELGQNIIYNDVLDNLVSYLFERKKGESGSWIHSVAVSLGLISKGNKTTVKGLKVMYYGAKAMLE